MDVHSYELERFGGSDGVRDTTLLESAIAQASMTFDGVFLHSDLFHMAAAYLFHIVKNHPFIDGNKRTGVAAALLFLRFNGLELSESNSERLYKATVDVVANQTTKEALGDILRGLPWTAVQE